MKPIENLSPEDVIVALSKQYGAAVNLLSQTNSRRTASARFYVSLASGLIGLLTLVYRQDVDTSTQVWTVNILCGFSVALNIAWFLTIRAMRHLGRVQRSLLTEMEESLPYAFVSRQVQIIDSSSSWLNTGKIEQYLPIAMMIPAVIIFLLMNFL